MQVLSEIIGHRRIVTMLALALEANRIHHAYLFAGPAGVGKETLARAFAAGLLCASPGRGDACGKCLPCRQLKGNNHPDLHVTAPMGTTIKINQLRELKRFTALEPLQGGRQVYLITRAETMTTEAANCLLRVLEEPPPGVFFLLVSHRPQGLLPTVTSRCEQLYCSPLAPGETEQVLARLGIASGEDVRRLAVLACGSPGRAQVLLDREKGPAYWLQRLTRVLPGSISQILLLTGELVEQKEDLTGLLELLLFWYRDLLIWRETGSPSLIYNNDCLPQISEVARDRKREELMIMIMEIERAKVRLAGNANQRLVLDNLFLKLAGSGPCRRNIGGS